MTHTVKAVYEGGVLRPLQPLHLPDHSEIEITIHMPQPGPAEPSLEQRGRSFIGIGRSGRRDISERAEEMLRTGFGR